MKQIIFSILILSMLAFSIVNVMSAEASNQTVNYPFVISPLERDALQILDNELNSIENKTLCNIAGMLEEKDLLKNITCAELPEAEIDGTEAKNFLLGKIITYYDAEGSPINYTIKENDLKDAILDVLQKRLPFTSNYDRVEIRLTRKVGVGMSNLNNETIYWYIYVDAVTGEAVKIEQMFQTAGGGTPRISEAPSTKPSEGTENGETEPGTESKINLTYLYYAIPAAIILLIIILFLAKRKR